jgi:hypothetical protein
VGILLEVETQHERIAGFLSAIRRNAYEAGYNAGFVGADLGESWANYAPDPNILQLEQTLAWNAQ